MSARHPWCRPLLFALALAAAQAGAQDLPARFEHDRVWLVPRLEGRELRIYTDTGGGPNAISRPLVESLGLATETVQVDGQPKTLTAFPSFDAGYGIPAAPAYFMRGRLAVADLASHLGEARDGFLGGRWFADGIWDFDYPRQRLAKLERHAPAKNAVAVPLGFQVNAEGERSTHFPSIAVEVDGEVLDMLFDTGATATLTDTSGPAFDLPAGTHIGTSFIEKEKFERWKQRHPDWRVLEQADAKGGQQRRMIEVPEIVVAGFRAGPVWFAEQPPGAFQRYMAQWMDRPAWGAIGGSGLKYFRVVVDYPAARAYFQPAAAP